MALTNKTHGERILPSVLAFFKERGVIKIILVVLIGIVLLILGTGAATGTAIDEADDLEVRLEELCSSLVGVGKCRVMLTYERSGTRYGAVEERRVESVAIVCRGADSAKVRSELTTLLTSLFGIGSHRISISKMK